MRTDNAARISTVSRRQALRAGVGVAIGAGVLSAGSVASADAGIQALNQQDGWRWCNKCKGFFYGPAVGSSRCPTGNTHNGSNSLPYFLFYTNDPPRDYMQPDWRWCRKCQGLAFNGNGPGWCPGAGRHDHTGSFNYHLIHDVSPLPNEQANWRWCNKCEGLFYGPQSGTSWCSESGQHYGRASYDYVINRL